MTSAAPPPLAQAILDQLARLDVTTAKFESIEVAIVELQSVPRISRWPKPGPPRPTTHEPLRPPANVLSPAEVLEAWTTRGESWLSGASRRDIRAAVFALHAEETRDQLVGDSSYLLALANRARAHQRKTIVTLAWFGVWKPKRIAVRLADRHFGPDAGPEWWTEVVSKKKKLIPALKRFGKAVLKNELRGPGDYDLPEVFWSSGWSSAVISSLEFRTLDELELVLRFADGGSLRAGAPMFPALCDTILKAVKIAQTGGLPQRDTAALVARRVGSPFDAGAEVRWSEVSAALPRVRAWLAGEVLRILFYHLVPANALTAHMTAPRRTFWTQYTGSVRRLWVLVPRRMRSRLKHPDVVKVQETMGEGLKILGLQGQQDQCIVWMHLEGGRGVVTVVEGNANTSIRIVDGEQAPPTDPVRYSDHIVHGAFSTDQPFTSVFVRSHNKGWEQYVMRELRARGISPAQL